MQKHQSKENSKKKKIALICFLILAALAAVGGVYSYFGGFGTGESADPVEFVKYAAKVEDITIPDGVTMIALGEATHGNREFQKLKRDVFKVMAEKYGVRAFTLEGDFGGCEAVNRYIHGGSGTAEEAAAAIGFDLYRTEETASLIEHMRKYNEQAAPGDDFRFYGFDMQRGLRSYTFLLEECEKQGVNTDEIQKLVKENDWTPEYSYAERKAAFEALKSTLTSRQASDFSVHLTDVLIQHCDFMGQLEAGMDSGSSNALRDSYMKENILWIADQEKRLGHGRIFISAHIGHAERMASYDNTGSLLAKDLGDAYYVIGTDFYKSVCNLPSGLTKKRDNHTFYSRDPLAKAAKKAGFDLCWLDLSRIPKNSSLKQYTTEYIYHGRLGDIHSPMMGLLPMTYRVMDNPEISYNSIIYVTNATPTEIR